MREEVSSTGIGWANKRRKTRRKSAGERWFASMRFVSFEREIRQWSAGGRRGLRDSRPRLLGLGKVPGEEADERKDDDYHEDTDGSDYRTSNGFRKRRAEIKARRVEFGLVEFGVKRILVLVVVVI